MNHIYLYCSVYITLNILEDLERMKIENKTKNYTEHLCKRRRNERREENVSQEWFHINDLQGELQIPY